MSDRLCECGRPLRTDSHARCEVCRRKDKRYDLCVCGNPKQRTRPMCSRCLDTRRKKSGRPANDGSGASVAFAIIQYPSDGRMKSSVGALCWSRENAKAVVAKAREIMPGVRLEIKRRRVGA